MFDLFFGLNFPKTPNFTIKFLEVLCPPHWILCIYTLLSCFPIAFPSFYHTLPPPNLCFPHYLGPCTSSPACRCHGDDSSCISRPELYGLRRWFGAGGIFFCCVRWHRQAQGFFSLSVWTYVAGKYTENVLSIRICARMLCIATGWYPLTHHDKVTCTEVNGPACMSTAA